jgi:hypothetical protein
MRFSTTILGLLFGLEAAALNAVPRTVQEIERAVRSILPCPGCHIKRLLRCEENGGDSLIWHAGCEICTIADRI